jgi:hypothetical protein
VDWYYKAALVVGLIWATARALGAYGEAARELDIEFLFRFMLTTGGWAAAFLVTDRVAKALGWRRRPPVPAAVSTTPDPVNAADPTSPTTAVPLVRPGARGQRSSRRSRR